MQFTQTEFLIFLPIVLALSWATRGAGQRNAFLLVASYYFYAFWDYRFCGLLLLSTIVDFVVARRIEQSKRPGSRKAWLTASLIVNLGMLGVFKYFDFFITSAGTLLEPLGLSVGALNLILPVGISFFTFQTLSYTIDVYRGKLGASRSFLDFALYVAFFPQLVAGPIVRATELLPQLSQVPEWSGRRCYGGFQLILRGLVKKVLLADRLGEMVDVVFAGPELYHGLTIWIAVLAYTGQIYYDFSGYTDIAIGVAKMLGYHFPRNFRHPYLATSISDFWRRWHMTLSRWLRDYVYIPMGGNRLGERRQLFNLIATMTLGGLWHGAAWTFVLWGLWHGIALATQRVVSSRIRVSFRAGFGWMLTLFVVVSGWVLFRSDGLPSALLIFERMASFSPGILWFPPLVLTALCLMFAEHCAWKTKVRRAMVLPFDRWYSPVLTAVMIGCLILYHPRGFSPFVYFQF